MKKNIALGMDLGGTQLKAGIISDTGDILEFQTYQTPKDSLDDLIKLLSNVVAEKDEQYNCKLKVGIGLPGIYDKQLKEIIIAPNLVSKQKPLCAEIQKQTNREIAFNNDANMAALGEAWQGDGKDYTDFLLLTLGTGVGAGIFANGKLFSGSKGWGGEIGNTIVFPEGEQCICGKKGCLEAYASASAVAKRYNAKAHTTLTTEQVFAAARNGDKHASAVINDALQALAIGIYNYVLLFNPQAIILGGGMAKAGDALLSPLKAQINEYLMHYPGVNQINILLATMENKAGVLGAAKAAFDMK